jgi:hypothetical protein
MLKGEPQCKWTDAGGLLTAVTEHFPMRRASSFSDGIASVGERWAIDAN